MSNRPTLAIFLLLLAAPVAAAQSGKPPLDPEPNAAYRWEVGIRCADHPLLSDAVRRQLARELGATLKAAIDPAGEVEVFDFSKGANDKQLVFKAFEAKGWTALDPDPLRELTGTKTHVLTVDYRDGVFQLAARQLDGFTGISSPVLRKQTTRAADLLGRVAALLVEPDFGPVGTVTPIPGDTEHVTVTFRGTAVAPPGKWVKPGDVLTVSAIRDQLKPADPKNPLPANFKGQLPTIRTGIPYAFTFLKVETLADAAGACKCVILTRFQEPFARDSRGQPTQKRVGLRAMKLATVGAKVRLRLVGPDGAAHTRGSLLQVTGTDLDFAADPGPNDVLKYENGLYRSGRVFNNIACVQVGIEGGKAQRFPIPVFSEDPVVVRFDVKPEDEEKAVFARECNDYRDRVYELVATQRALFEKVNKLLDSSKSREALTVAEAGQTRVIEAQKTLADDLKLLRQKPLAAEDGIKKILESSDKSLAAVETGRANLAKLMGDLREVAKKSDDPTKLEVEFRSKELADRITEYVKRGDIPEALETYEKLINLVPAQQDVKDAREKLLAEWRPKDDEHRKAREVMKKWTTAKTGEDFKELALELKVAIGTLERKKDKLGLRKLQNTFEPAYSALSKLLNELDGTTEDGAKAVKEMQGIVELVRVVEDDTRVSLKKVLDAK